MKEIILCKLGETILKGANRSNFESILLRSLRRRAETCGRFRVYMLQSTVYIEPQDETCDLTRMHELACRVFGLVGVVRAAECEKNMEAILACARDYLPPLMAGVRRFRVDAKRSDKSFPVPSPEIAARVGGVILASVPGCRVDLHDPEAEIRVEVRDRCAYVHAGQTPGAGGLPYGSSGRGMLLLSGGIDSPVAGYLMAKRGLALDAVYFETPPYTSQQAREKVLTLADKLCVYTGRLRVHVISLTEIQETLMRDCDEDYFTLLLRRFMMRLAQACAREQGCEALVTGESLGQVASQTLASMAVTGAGLEMPLFRPCVGLDKSEIIAYARRIDTFETSILPYEDCCTVFTPRHPHTKPRPDAFEAELAKVDFDGLCERALATRETVERRMK
ncbi:MAG: tRNA 4-thiouridine(8) synthase ThiI [Clostridia bacterium]|nr:tRNA 4-thiouridine(8) synthase ThiI [Clostridia bacterium]